MAKIGVVSAVCCAMVLQFASLGNAQQQVEFNRDIRPILSDKCFLCHGPDEAGRKSDFRLDIESDAHEFAFVPDSLEDSEAWQRINSDDPSEIMPPPEIHKQLTPQETELIKTWIESGAKYQDHWAFRKPVKPEVPKVTDPRFSQTAIDAFIFQAMKSRGLNPSARADKATLIRRVSLDLTGLPPTIEQVEDFLQDDSPDAFEKVVDRLLASPQFGERMAVDWLDVARYGDTSVFHADGPRDMWRWRDWVINAYNNNLPFNEFTIKQLAGDLLPDATIDDQIASGFNRNNASTDEGGAIAEEFRIEYAVDRVKTTSMVWMGLSMECAQCHDHKYDPVSQEDYYRFFAFFNQAADPGMQSRRGNQSPIVNVLDESLVAQVPAIEKKVANLKQELASLRNSKQDAYQKWLADPELANQAVPMPEDLASHLSFDQQGKDVVNEVLKDDKIKTSGKVQFPEGKFGKAIRTKKNVFLRSPKTAENFTGDEAISYGCWIKLAGGQSGAPIARMDEDSEHVGFDLYVQGGSVGAHIIHKWPENAIKVLASKKLKKGNWHHVFITYDGSKKASGVKVYVDGEFLKSKPSHDSLTGSTKCKTPFSVGRRHKSSQFDGFVDDVRVYNRELTLSEVATIGEMDPLPDLLAVDVKDRTEAQNDQLFSVFMDRNVPQQRSLKESITKSEAEIAKLKTPITTVMVMKDVPKPRMTYVLDRGQYDAPNKEKPVEPGVPKFLPEFQESLGKNRLGMAKWLTSPDHPLTSRVTVNRIWRMFFGIGMVETVEDFGLQGSWPSHPQLLDWMASDFVEHNWDTKRLIKIIVMSQTYQQSSVVTAKQLEMDPANRYLSRGPRFRLAGEFLRDQTLAISGLLNSKLGGQGVKPYQPDGLWNEVSLQGGLRFKRDNGDKLYRRSLYTYWKRSSPPPSMVIFDAPSREKCTVRRGTTNTPLQALVLLNDPQFVEAARIFAERIINEGGTTIESKIEFAVRAATSKPPSESMTSVLKQMYQTELTTFKADVEGAKKLLSTGEKPRDEKLDAAEVAAWTIISNLIFNLDEFVTRG